MQQALNPFLTNHSNGERGGWELGFCQIISVKLDNSRQNLTLGEKREQLRASFRKGGFLIAQKAQDERRQGGVGVGQAGSRTA